MAGAPLLVDVDRDSVAMGDDMSSHAYRVSFPEGTRIAKVLERTHPEIHARGWSWVAVVDGTVTAVWSIDHGVRLLVRNRRLRASAEPVCVVFRYFLQLDPEWLHTRLSAGAPADRRALSAEFAPIAAERDEREQRRRERDVREKLLSPACIEILIAFGADIDLHSDDRCRFAADGSVWTVRRADSMILVYRSEARDSVASLRPLAFAESWVAAAVGAQHRAARGLPALPAYSQNPGPRLETMASWPPDTSRWSATGDDGFVAQLAGSESLAVYRFALGRSLPEIRAALTIP